MGYPYRLSADRFRFPRGPSGTEGELIERGRCSAVILAGLITGVLAWYWLVPKVLAARIVRQHEAFNRLRNEGKR